MSKPAVTEPAFTYVGQDLDALAGIINYQNWIIRGFRPYVRGAVLEIGAGSGTYSEHLLAMADRLILLEPDGTLVKALNRRFSGKVTVIGGTVEAALDKVPDQTLDAVVMINVLEHIQDDRAAVQAISRKLKPGGHLCVFVPALPCLMSNLDLKLGHFRRYTKPLIWHALGGSPLQVRVLRYFDVAGAFPWWLLNSKLGSTGFNLVLARIYDRFVVPPMRRLERFIPLPFGKNLVLVAQKEVSSCV